MALVKKQWYMLARALGEALYLNDLDFPTEDEK